MDERPKPHPPKPQPQKTVEPPAQKSSVTPKKPYVLRPHLTQMPLRDNEGLINLKRSMEKSIPQKKKRIQRRKPQEKK